MREQNRNIYIYQDSKLAFSNEGVHYKLGSDKSLQMEGELRSTSCKHSGILYSKVTSSEEHLNLHSKLNEYSPGCFCLIYGDPPRAGQWKSSKLSPS